MLITYCQKCHIILTTDKLEDSNLCDDCAAGHTRRLTRSRNSDQISRKRLTALSRKPIPKLEKPNNDSDSDGDLPKVIATPERDEIC